jgi:hypothetical protein
MFCAALMVASASAAASVRAIGIPAPAGVMLGAFIPSLRTLIFENGATRAFTVLLLA